MLMIKAVSFVREMDFKSIRLRMKLDTGQLGAVLLLEFSSWLIYCAVCDCFLLPVDCFQGCH